MPTSRQEIMRALDNLPIDQTIHAAPMKGGSKQAKRTLTRFVADRLPQYHTKRNDLNEDASSGLSPWLHFGHISTHEILSHVLPTNPSPDFETIRGQREGWWRLSPGTEAFLDQLLVWRELGFNGCTWIPDFERYDSLPSWALQTLQQHAGDPRSYLYTYEQFRDGQTHDALWNAAQQQLVREGRMHNYLRMLWGKKILEWSPDARRAFNTMLEINNRYALDGRDPNSWSGIAWVLGRYDRAWGPERPIFGKVRYMSSKNTARKYRTTDYVARYTTQSTAPSI
jgi:deoxyribodipyrimidine photo-lyase